MFLFYIFDGTVRRIYPPTKRRIAQNGYFAATRLFSYSSLLTSTILNDTVRRVISLLDRRSLRDTIAKRSLLQSIPVMHFSHRNVCHFQLRELVSGRKLNVWTRNTSSTRDRQDLDEGKHDILLYRLSSKRYSLFVIEFS